MFGTDMAKPERAGRSRIMDVLDYALGCTALRSPPRVDSF
jgi:hypothetical protein